MEKLKGQPQFKHGESVKTGILLCNLGTPTKPNKKSVKKYLKQFLSDQRVVEIPKILWWPILNIIILNTRPKNLHMHTPKYGQKKVLLFFTIVIIWPKP